MEKISNRSSNVWTGLLLLIIGGALLLRHFSYFSIPWWVFSWQMLVIAIGFFIGVKHQFRGSGWLITMLVGIVFLMPIFIPGFWAYSYTWPLILIIAGIYLIIRPKRTKQRWQAKDKGQYLEEGEQASEDYIDFTSAFGGVHKVIMSKDFKGGSITTFFGGTKINLSQADIISSATLDVTQVFGGTKIIVPANWDIKSEMTAIFGGVEDKRNPQASTTPMKVLVLKGISIFGGLEISNF